MKKFILGIAALVSIGAFAAAFDYSHAYDPMDISNISTFDKIDVTLTNTVHEKLGIINGDGSGLDKKTYKLDGKYLVPKSIKGHDLAIFIHADPDYQLIGDEDNDPTETITDSVEVVISNDKFMNNMPEFLYVYDKNTKELHKIYKEDGSRAVFRHINSENVDELKPEDVKAEDFTFGNGYIEATDLYKFNIGEIKAKDTSKDTTPELDRARHGVTGETVYNYLEKQKADANLENPTDSLISDTKVKNYVEGKLAGLAVDGVSEFDYSKDEYPVIEFKEDKGTDKVLRGIADAINGNDAVNKRQLDSEIGKLNDRIDALGGDLSKANAGVSTAVAIANLPLEFTPERPNSFAFGVGYYGKHAGFALGYGRKLIDNSLTLRVTSSINTAADFAAGVGVGYAW